MSRKPGDWDCAQCNHLNFSRRDSCQRCGEARDRPPRDHSAADFSSSSSRSGGGGGGSRSYGFISASSARFGGGGIGSGDVRPGDWYCADCNAHNFASRTGCYKCGASRDEEPENGGGGGGGGGGRFDSGGWREQAPRRYVVAPTPAASSYGRSSWKSGDWICPRMGCEEHNFASRIECFRCNARRETAGM